MHGHKESYKDLNLKILTSECDSNPRPHTTTTTCVYLDRQIALPIWGAIRVFFL